MGRIEPMAVTRKDVVARLGRNNVVSEGRKESTVERRREEDQREMHTLNIQEQDAHNGNGVLTL